MRFLAKLFGLGAKASLIIIFKGLFDFVTCDYTYNPMCGMGVGGIGFFFILCFILVLLSKGCSITDTSLSQYLENSRAKDPNLPFVLLLRPFSVDQSILEDNPNLKSAGFSDLRTSIWDEKFEIFIEQLLSRALKPKFQLRIIGGSTIGPGIILTADDPVSEIQFSTDGKPLINPELLSSDIFLDGKRVWISSADKFLGGKRVWTEDEFWRPTFQKLADESKGIIIIPLPGKEIPWEITQLRKNGCLSKAIFLIPKKDKITTFTSTSIYDFWVKLQEMGFNLPYPGTDSVIVTLDSLGNVVEIIPIETLDHKTLQIALNDRWLSKLYAE